MHCLTAEMTGSRLHRRFRKAVGGFTLVEAMVGFAITVAIAGAIMSVFLMSLRSWKEGSRDLSVQSSGRLIMEKIVRGPGGRFGLREAAEGSVTVDPDGKGITFLVDKNNPPTYEESDDTQVRIYLLANSIIYDPSTAVHGDEVPIVSFGRVDNLRFEIDGKAVNIELFMREMSGTTNPSQVKFRTKAFLRKSADADTET